MCVIRLAMSSMLAVLLMAMPARSLAASTGSVPPAASPAQNTHIPIVFEVNQGQTNRQVRFLAHAPGSTVFLTRTGITLALTGSSNPGSRSLVRGSMPRTQPSHLGEVALRLLPAGMNRHVVITGTDPLPGRVNYFIGNNRKNWHTNIPTYGAVTYHNVYPHIDLRFYGGAKGLEYDWIVGPQGNPNQIAMQVRGTAQGALRIDRQGNLVMRTGLGTVTQNKPVIYQAIGGVRHQVSGHFTLDTNQQIRFRVGSFDASRPLVIDPGLVYSTYLGGSSRDGGNGIAIDGSGNAYVTGLTNSTDFPVTPGAFQPTNHGDYDAFVTKLNASGSALLYSTYLGGSNGDGGFGIAVDASGNAYVTGGTDSINFPVTPGAFQSIWRGYNDAFVTKLNATGSALLYSTYLASSGDDVGDGIAIDSSGHAYVTGYTHSTDFPVTPGAFQIVNHGVYDAFVTKLNASGSGLLYSTYLGGSSYDDGRGIAVDASGNAYVTGDTDSTDFPVTPGAFQTTNHGVIDAFVTKLNAAGSGLLYSTYLGGSYYDYGSGIAVDSSGDAFVTGRTESANFPVTAGAFQTTYAGNADAFVARLNATGSGLLYSTYLGGSDFDRGYGIAVDSSGNAYVTGSTNSSNFPVTTGAYQTTNAGSFDAFVTRLNTTGSALLYSSYLGGSSDDSGSSIAVDGSGNAYVTGSTYSANFPVTPGAFQPTNHGDYDAFVTKLSPTASTTTQPCAYVSGSYSPSSYYVSYGNSPNQSFTINATERYGTVSSGSYVTYAATTAAGTISFHSSSVSAVAISGNNATVTGTGVITVTSGGTTTSYTVSYQVNVTGNNTTTHNTFELFTSGGYTYDSGVVLVPPPPGTSPAIRVSSTC